MTIAIQDQTGLVEVINPVPLYPQIQTRKSPRPFKSAPSLSALWDRYVECRGKLAVTTHRNLSTAKHIFVEWMEPKKLSPDTVVDWANAFLNRRVGMKNWRSDRLPKPAYANLIFRLVRGFLRWLHDHDYTPKDYGRLLRSVPIPHPEAPKILSYADYLRVLEYLEGKPHFDMHRWLITLGYRTGMSLVDCCHLRWSNVHLNDNDVSYVEICRIKVNRFGRRCMIPILPGSDLWDWLQILKKQERYKRADGINDYVHQEAPGSYMYKDGALGRSIVDIFKRAKCPGITFKQLRNSFISNMVNADVNPALVCKMTGHANTEMLVHYLNPDKRALAESAIKGFAFAESTNQLDIHGTTRSIQTSTAITAAAAV